MRATKTVTETVNAAVKAGIRFKDLKSIQWRLVTADGQYVQPFSFCSLERPKLGPAETALMFDGRDNEKMKTGLYSALLKTPVHAELISLNT